MKTLCSTLLLLLLIFTLSFCSKDWLEEKAVKSQQVPSSLDDFRAMLDFPTISFLQSPFLTEIAVDNHIYTEATWASFKSTFIGNAFTWSNNVAYTSIADWNSSYSAVLRLNIVLEGIDKIAEEKRSKESDQLYGEALLYRSNYFYGVAMTFSPSYDQENANKPLGIPLRVKSDVEKPALRSTVQETYDQILKDLKIARELLPVSSDYLTRPTKLSATGYLARVYLSMEMYDSAFKYADLYLKSKNTLIDFNKLSTSALFIGPNEEVGLFNLSSFAALNNYFVPVSLFDKYHINDLRKKVYFQSVSGQYRFKGSYSKNANENFTGIATDEMYLIRSECMARKDMIGDALMDLNYLLRSRFLKVNGQSTYVDYTTTVQIEVLRKIFEEREKELILRNVRWSDLRRLNKDPRFAKTIIRIIGGVTYTLEPNSYRYTFPIPADIISRTTLLQNPGWE